VEPNVSAVERAFQLARAGKATDMKGLVTILKKEGYFSGQVERMPALSKQLRAIMAAAQDQPPNKSQRAPE
jgi:hypothetical protein